MPLVKTRLGRRTPTIATNQMGSPGPGSRVAGSFAERSQAKQSRLMEMQGLRNTGQMNVAREGTTSAVNVAMLGSATDMARQRLVNTGDMAEQNLRTGPGSPAMIGAKAGAEKSQLYPFQTTDPMGGTTTSYRRLNAETGQFEDVGTGGQDQDSAWIAKFNPKDVASFKGYYDKQSQDVQTRILDTLFKFNRPLLESLNKLTNKTTDQTKRLELEKKKGLGRRPLGKRTAGSLVPQSVRSFGSNVAQAFGGLFGR